MYLKLNLGIKISKILEVVINIVLTFIGCVYYRRICRHVVPKYYSSTARPCCWNAKYRMTV